MQRIVKSTHYDRVFYLYGTTEETVTVGDEGFLKIHGIRYSVIPVDPSIASYVTMTVDGTDTMTLLGNGVWPTYDYGTATEDIVFTPTNATFSILLDTGVSP